MAMDSTRSDSHRNNWTLGIVSVALFMVVLDNLVVSIALPSIHRDLGASIQSLEWTVNAYVLAYAVLLLTGAALGDRFGRRRMFLVGLTIFTAASAAAALAPTTGLLVLARAVQGAGAALVTPLTLTLLAEAFPTDRGSEGSPIGQRRGMAVGHLRCRRRDRPARRGRRRAGNLLALDLLDQRPHRPGPAPARGGTPA
jgi:MFS family permease